MGVIPARFDSLWAHLPQWFEFEDIPVQKPKKPTKKRHPDIPGVEIPKGWETCCIQMSYALNHAGAPIPNSKADLRDSTGDNYMLRVPDMRAFLDSAYGAATKFQRVSDDDKSLIPRWLLMEMMSDIRGIIAFGNRHIDMWSSSEIHGESYIPEALWEDKSTLKLGVFVWHTY